MKQLSWPRRLGVHFLHSVILPIPSRSMGIESELPSQTWLSERLSKNYNMVNSYCQQRRQPRLEVLFEIARILDVDVRDLIDNSHLETKKEEKVDANY